MATMWRVEIINLDTGDVEQEVALVSDIVRWFPEIDRKFFEHFNVGDFHFEFTSPNGEQVYWKFMSYPE